MNVDVRGRVRKLLEAIDASSVSDAEQLTLTPQLELLIAAGAAPYRETTRAGRAFLTGTTAALAGVIAIPSTAAMLTLWNSAAAGGRSMVIDWIAASGVAKTAAAGQAQMLALIGQLADAAPAAAALTIKKLNGNGVVSGATDSVALPSTAALPAATGVAGNWFPLGPAVGFPGAAATPGHGLFVPVDGRIIVPPSRSFAVHVLADVVGSTFLAYVAWHEAQLTLG